ncbi:MAG: D-alanine--D-alanine ligase [Chitinophagaceae bacterium]|nr:D-alanine--D-alanine ligase [Chitinophagaceae bacterium]
MKKRIAIVTGGYSGEAEISYKSVITVSNNVDSEKFDSYIIDINTNDWNYKNENGEKLFIDKNNFTLNNNGVIIQFDAVLMCIHGTPGEDGKLQGYFDMLNLPYTSCDAATSAITFNKKFTVAVAANGGIHVSKSVMLFKQNAINEKEILEQLSLPVFVKPNNGGSSIGMSKINNPTHLSNAIQKAFKEDNQILIEEFIEGREFTIGVFKTKGKIITLPITEIISKNEFFDFEAKYLGKSNEITPAIVEESIAEQVRDAAKKLYSLFNCRGIVRIDFIYNKKNNQPYMLEINTVPGQSEASIVPQQVLAMGWSLQDFYTALIEECFE